MPRTESMIRAQKKYRDRLKEAIKKGEIKPPIHEKKALEKYLNKPDKFKQFREYQLNYYKKKCYYNEDNILKSIRNLFNIKDLKKLI